MRATMPDDSRVLPNHAPPRAGMFVWLAALFFAALILFTRGNTFPFFYHPDEPSKVEQLLGARWNFNHPLLLLGAAKIAITLAPIERDPQRVAVAGRWVSAAFCALSVATLSALAWRLRGRFAAVATGGLLLLDHQLFELSHYLKEDTALLAGVTLSLLALDVFVKKPSPARAVFLGAACGLAISGKYLGAVMIAFALPALFSKKGENRLANFTAFFSGLLVVFAAINFPLLRDGATFRASFHREASLVAHGQHGGGGRVPHLEYWKTFVDNVTPALWPFLLAAYFSPAPCGKQPGRFARKNRRNLAEWSILIFPVAYAALLSFSVKTNDRYFLPATAAFLLMAGLGVSDAAEVLRDYLAKKNPGRARVAPILLAWALAAQLPGLIGYANAFRHDDRAEMIAWIRSNLPADAVIFQTTRVQLPSPHSAGVKFFGPLRQKIETEKYQPEPHEAPFSVAALRARGVSHAVISESDYGRFFRGIAKTGDAPKRAFFSEVKSFPLLWSRPRSKVIYLHPGLEIYEIARATSKK